MRIQFEHPNLGFETGTTRRPVKAPIRGYTNGFLTLPRLSRKVPARSVNEDDKKWLQVAKLCAELVEEDEVKIHNRATARDIIVSTLSAWASKHCANISVLDGFDLVAGLDVEALTFACYEDANLNTPSWYVGFESTQVTRYINIKDKIEMLEQLHPGLGQTALSYAERAGYQTIQVLSPRVGFDLGQYLYWYGTDNDEDYREEMGAYGEEGEELDEEVFLPSTYRQAFPELFLTGTCLERDALLSIASETDIAGETALIILSIMDLIDQKAGLPDMSGHDVESAFFSCYLGIGGENDMIDRLLDDHFQCVNQSSDGYTSMHGIASVPFDRTLFQKWREEMEKGFALYTQLDHLINKIGDIRN